MSPQPEVTDMVFDESSPWPVSKTETRILHGVRRADGQVRVVVDTEAAARLLVAAGKGLTYVRSVETALVSRTRFKVVGGTDPAAG